MYLQDMGCGSMGWPGSGLGKVAGPCKCGNETSGSAKCGIC